MWIIDSCYRNGAVDLWEKGPGIRRSTIPFAPSFLLRIPDPALHWELIEALESRYRVEECTIRTVYGVCGGYRIDAGRDVAEAIERQTHFTAELYNVDIRLDQQYLAGQGLVHCIKPGESRYSPGFEIPLEILEVAVQDNPFSPGEFCSIRVLHEREEHLEGDERNVLADLASLISGCDPDVIIFPGSDLWLPRILSRARKYGITIPFSRSGRFRKMEEKSYWSYGRTEYRAGSLIPDGRILVDSRQSFHYRESGLAGIILGARLSGLPPNLAARVTSGTLISSYEVYEALRRGIAVPFRKSDPEAVRKFEALKAADRGGMMFQPAPGIYEHVHEIDFTSLYPAIIVAFNLSPETFSAPCRQGFLPEVLEPLLALRKETKQRKVAAPEYAGLDSLLKWMLVTCFGYTGYKNAKFGRIEVHEQITGKAREILIKTKDIAEEMGFSVLHGIVDCLWVQGKPQAEALKIRVECETGLHTTIGTYDWLVFLPMTDGSGSYNRYYGRLMDGSLKIRGIMARRRDTPVYVRSMQQGLLDLMGRACSRDDLRVLRDEALHRYLDAVEGLGSADPADMAIHRQISRLQYSRCCPEGSAVKACIREGIDLAPGMEVGYVITNAERWEVDLDWKATRFDTGYYQGLLEKAWAEVSFAFDEARQLAGTVQ